MYRRIMIPLDGSELAECVFAHLEVISKGSPPDVIDLVRVVEPMELPTRGGIALSHQDIEQIERHLMDEATTYLKRISDRFTRIGLNIEIKVIKGNAPESLVRHSEESRPDLIMIATHGRSGISRWVWGSVADRILRLTSIPVFLVRAPGCKPEIK